MSEAVEKEKILVEKTKNSDQNAYKELYYMYSDKLFGFLLRKVGNEDLAKDLVQDLFFKLWTNRSNLDENQSIKAYLYRSANNLAIDYYRKKRIFASQDSEEVTNEFYNMDIVFDIRDEVREQIEKLPEMQQKVFVMSRFEELKYKEIAQSLNISQKTVESHMSKALNKLRNNLKHLISIILFIFFQIQDRVSSLFERIL